MIIDGNTKTYGIIGNPVNHSLSPAMHNAAFAELGENRIYLPFHVEDIRAALQGVRSLQIQGVSVTIPHKEGVIEHLDIIDPIATKIGAVNTIKRVEQNGTILLCGYNTDWLGAVKPLKKVMELAGAKVVLLGAGGSARAIGFGLLEEGAKLELCSRTESRGRKLADDLSCKWLSLEQIDTIAGDVLINATSVGMHPNDHQSPAPAHILSRFKVVMDIVYAPLNTQLLQVAEQAGCTTINGLEMLLYQGIAQFELWTELHAPENIMRKVLVAAVTGK